MNHVPAIGRIIHVVLEDKAGARFERPAIIVRTWQGTEPGTVASYVNVQVFTDEGNDGLTGTVWKTSVTHDPTGQAANSWHWPDEGGAK